MNVQKKKTVAGRILGYNGWLAAVCMGAALSATFYRRSLLQSSWLQLLVFFCGAIVLYVVVSMSYRFLLPRLSFLIASLLAEIGLPQRLQEGRGFAEGFVFVGTLLLWFPVFIALLMTASGSVSDGDLTSLIVYLFLWVAFFRMLDYAERRALPSAAVTEEEQQEQDGRFLVLWLLFVCFCGLALAFAGYRLFLLDGVFAAFTTKQKQVTILAVAGMLFAVFVAVIYVRLARKNRIALERLTLQNQIEQKELYISLMTEKYQTLRQYHHDFRKHLTYIQGLAQMEDVRGITRYIEAVYDDLQSDGLQRLTGKQELDILFSDKLSQAKRMAVQFDIDYQPPVQLQQMTAPDLCMVLGNLLDNALQAAANSAARWVWCEMYRKNAYMDLIVVGNSCDVPPLFVNGLPVSQRGEDHGYGTKIVQRKVQQYGGHCLFAYDDNAKEFIVKLLLPTENFSAG